MMRRIKLIAFDFDGPILDSWEAAKKSIYRACVKLNLPRPAEESLILNWGHPGLVAIKRMFPQITEQEAKDFIEYWAKNDKKVKLYLVKGVKKALANIKKLGILTALLTARSHNLKLHFCRHGLEKYFDFFQSFDHPTLPKEIAHPNHIFNSSLKDGPDFFDNLLKWAAQKNISKNEMIFIDDTLPGLRIAKKINLLFLGVCTGPLSSKKYWQKYGHLAQKYVLRSIADMPRWLNKNMGM